MRILFVSNLFPSYNMLGGYEQWCQEVANELAQRGHQVRVITTRSRNGNGIVIEKNDVSVSAVLNFEVELDAGLVKSTLRMIKDCARLERESLLQVREELDGFNPDVVLIWGMWNVPRSIPALLEEHLPDRIAYYLCDYWPSLPDSFTQMWQEPSRNPVLRLPKLLLAKPVLAHLRNTTPKRLKLEKTICVSGALRELLLQSGVPIPDARVIYGGTQVEEFMRVSRHRSQSPSNALRLLYLGRIRPDKGVHTLIEAVGITAKMKGTPVTLDIVGNGIPDYIESLQRMVEARKLNEIISFHAGIPRSKIPSLFSQYDVLVFPSEWQEPFARTVLEAMAAGLVVIGTTTGGTGEILVEGQTGLTYPAGDAHRLAVQIQRLQADLALRRQLAENGQKRVSDHFSINRMVDQIEGELLGLCVED